MIGLVLTVAIMFIVYYSVSYYSEANKMAEELNVANSYMDQEDYISAIAAYNAALEYDPENHATQGEVSYSLGEDKAGSKGASIRVSGLLYLRYFFL